MDKPDKTEVTQQKQPTDQQRKFMGVVELIDMITPRGALRGNELLNVGSLRQACLEEFKEFIDTNNAQ